MFYDFIFETYKINNNNNKRPFMFFWIFKKCVLLYINYKFFYFCPFLFLYIIILSFVLYSDKK